MTTQAPDATVEALLDGIRNEVREAVEEGDRQDCSSPDCIADAVHEIVRVRLAATPVAGLLRAARLMAESAGHSRGCAMVSEGWDQCDYCDGVAEYARLVYRALTPDPQDDPA